MERLKNKLQSMWQMWRIIGKSLPLIWSAAPGEVSFLGLILLVQGAIPAISIWLIKLVVDGVVAILDGAQSAEILLPLVVVWGVMFLIEAGLGPVQLMLMGNLNEKLTAHVNLILMDKASHIPDLEPFEDSQFYDDLQILQRYASSRPLNLVIILVTGTRQLLTAASMLILLATLGWWIPLLVALFIVPQSQIIVNLQAMAWRALLQKSEEVRRMQYYSKITLTDSFAKEVRLFNLGDYFQTKYKEAFHSLHDEMRGVRQQQVIRSMPMICLAIVVNLVIFAWVVYQAAAGQLSAGDVVLFIQSLAQMQRYVMDLLENIGFLYEKVLFFEKLHQFLAFESPLPLAANPVDVPETIETIEFNDVSFSYADGSPALHQVSFTLQPGERVALVGENGAGKTTIVKLLARFYDPTAGRILINDIDLKDLDLSAWRQRMGVIFQDFGRYHLSVNDNIAIGNIKHVDDSDVLKLASEKAGFDAVAAAMPDGYKTMLGKQFAGTELSGGQWQKLATARAFMPGKSLLVLDEPSAALDPRSEHELFKDFARLTRQRTTLLITHRLGSVCMADRILVLKAGELIEDGTHFDLLSANAEYAELYRMQRDMYDDESVSEPVNGAVPAPANGD